MFEKRLEEVSKKLNSGKEKEFFILTHKKHRREIYFQNNQRAISFIKKKFYSKKKSMISSLFYLLTYSLIKTGLLQLFLKKIYLSKYFGGVVFVAGQIKGFNLSEKEVISFPLEEKDKKTFIKVKRFERKIAKGVGFAPKLIKLDEEIPYSKEELLKECGSGREVEIFKKLILFYSSQGIKEISSKIYIKSLINRMNEKSIKNKYLMNMLKKLLKFDKKILITILHGDFGKENILINKKNLPVFIDWEPDKGLIIWDLINFFRGEKDLLKNKKFLEILKIFPKQVQENIGLYIILNEISGILKDGKVNKLSMERIKKCHHLFFLLKINPPR